MYEGLLRPLPDQHVRILADKLYDKQLSLFVGAGLSHLAPARDGGERRLPLWRGLAASVATLCHENAGAYRDILDLFDAIAFGQDRPTLERAVRQSLSDGDMTLSDAHYALMDLPWAALFTTNYDRLLTRVSGETPVVDERDYERLYAPPEQRPRLFQLHGDVDRPHTLTRDDYRLWPQKHERAYTHLKEFLLEHTLLFVGYSFSDPHLDSLLATIRGLTAGREKRLFAWMCKLDSAQAALLDKRDGISAVAINEEAQWASAFRQLGEALEARRRGVDEALPSFPARPFAYDRDQYLAAVRHRYDIADLRGLYPGAADSAAGDVTLSGVFVEPDLLISGANSFDGGGGDLSAVFDEAAESLHEWPVEEQRLPASVARLRARRLFVSGAPGQGKSALLRSTLIEEAAEWREAPDRHPLPVLIGLGDWEASGRPAEGMLIASVREQLPRLGEIGSAAVQHWLEGEVLWLLDGIDEVRDPHRRSRLMAEVRATAASRPNDRWVLTTRSADEAELALGADWTGATLPALTEEQISTVLARWAILLKSKDRLDLECQRLERSLADDPGMRMLRGNALLLTLAVMFYRSRRKLPRDRWEFYEAAEQTLRDAWIRHRMADADRHLPGSYLPELLENLALAGMVDGTTLFTQQRLERELGALLAGRGYSGRERDRETLRVVRSARDLIGVMVARGPNHFAFLHLTFQEFYAARALVHRSGEVADYVRRFWDHPDWQDLWTLYLLGVSADRSRVEQIFETILASGHPLDVELHRPKLACLRLAGVGAEPLPQRARAVLTWARQVLSSEDYPLLSVLRVLAQWERTLPADLGRLVVRTVSHRIGRGTPHTVSLLTSAIEKSAVRYGLSEDAMTALLTPDMPDEVGDSRETRDTLLIKLSAGHWTDRFSASKALAGMAGDPVVWRALVAALSDEVEFVRHGAAQSLAAAVGETAVREALIRRLDDEDALVRSTAAAALAGAVFDPAVRSSLIDRLADEGDGDARRVVVEALSNVAHEPTVRNALRRRLSDPDMHVQSAAARSLMTSIIAEKFGFEGAEAGLGAIGG